MKCSIPGFPVLHYLPEFAQIHVQWVSDAIQLSHSLTSPSPPVLKLSQHQGLFQWVGSSYQDLQVPESCIKWSGLLILMSFSGPFNLASGGFSAAPPLIKNCLNPPIGTQGWSWRQEMRDRKVSMPGSPISPLWFQSFIGWFGILLDFYVSFLRLYRM